MTRIRLVGAIAILASVFTIGGCGDSNVTVDLGPDVDLGGGDQGPQSPCETAEDCDDDIPCTIDGCNPERFMCTREFQHPMCDDGNPCHAAQCTETGCDNSNLADGTSCTDAGGADGTCTAGVCSSGCLVDQDCMDEIACTTGSCNVSTGICNAQDLDNAACEDGNECTTDVCTLTGCSATLVANGTACTDNAGSAGTCVAGECGTGCTQNSDCNDDISCTTDTCNTANGVCSNLADNSLCDDEVGCTTDVCQPGVGCMATTNDALCDDNVACTVDICDADDGCSVEPLDGRCDDSVGCTMDTCSVTLGCQQAPVQASCDDSNPCTADACDVDTDCSNEAVADGITCQNGAGSNGLCQSGACEVGCTSNADCLDTNVCNGAESCDLSMGVCVTGTALNCDDGFACTTDTCDPTDGCESAPSDAACNDGISCTTDSCSTATGCENMPSAAACDDSNPCTSNACDADEGCETTNVGNGVPCVTGGDNGLCNGNGTCVVGCTQNSDCVDATVCNGAETCNTTNGQCVPGTALNCDDGVACSTDSCSPTAGCGHMANNAACEDGNPCTTNTCSVTGGCSQTNVMNTTACTTGAGDGQCQAGVCVIGCTNSAQCNDNVACTTDTCDLGTGQCQNATNNTMCNDSVACTTDVCTATGCTNTTNNAACNDSNPCTTNTCTETGCASTNVMNNTPCQNAGGNNGLCQAGACSVQCTTNANCVDSTVCNGAETCNTSNGQCVAGTALVCNDGVACTTDSCNASTGCQFTTVNANCNDGVACTTDTCTAAGCNFAPSSTACNDNNSCTTEICNQGSGCAVTNVNNGVPCNNGNPGLCNGNGMCVVQCTNNAGCVDSTVCNGAETCNSNGQCVAGTPLNCNDSVACTSDTCSPTAGCQNNPVNSMCNDSTSCTTDTCNATTGCQFTPDNSCEDGNTCTVNLCVSGTGCSMTNAMDGIACGTGGMCMSGVCQTTTPRLFRLNSARIEDPHMHLDKRVTVIIVQVNLCGDITNDPEPLPTGGNIPALNPTFATLVSTDGDDADMFLDFSYVFDFDNLVQTNLATGVVNAVESNCTSATNCVPTPSGTNVSFNYEIRRTGTCTLPHMANVHTGTWVGPTDPMTVVNTSVSGASGCFMTTNSVPNGNARTFNLELTLQGTNVVIPLRDTAFSGTLTGNPATGVENGVLAGFLTYADANINVNITDPISVTVNLRNDVLPDGTSSAACNGSGGRPAQPDGYDDGMAPGMAQHPTLGAGWWFFVDYTSGQVTVSSGY